MNVLLVVEREHGLHRGAIDLRTDFLFPSRGSVGRQFVRHDARFKDTLGRVVERGLNSAYDERFTLLDLALLGRLARRDVEERAAPRNAEDLFDGVGHGRLDGLDDLLLGLLDAALLAGLVRVEAEGPAAYSERRGAVGGLLDGQGGGAEGERSDDCLVHLDLH